MVERVAVFVFKVKGGGYGQRLANAGGFDQQVVKAALRSELFYFQQQIFAQRAANAAVAHLHHFFLGARQSCTRVRGAFVHQRGVNIDLAHVVNDDRHAQAFAVGQNVVQQRGFTRAQKAGEHGDG